MDEVLAEELFYKVIIYDRETHDYAIYIDDMLIGHAVDYDLADKTADSIVTSLLTLVAFYPQIDRLLDELAQYRPCERAPPD